MYGVENARFQVTSGTKDPPAEKPIKLTKIEKTILYHIYTIYTEKTILYHTYAVYIYIYISRKFYHT